MKMKTCFHHSFIQLLTRQSVNFSLTLLVCASAVWVCYWSDHAMKLCVMQYCVCFCLVNLLHLNIPLTTRVSGNKAYSVTSSNSFVQGHTDTYPQNANTTGSDHWIIITHDSSTLSPTLLQTKSKRQYYHINGWYIYVWPW